MPAPEYPVPIRFLYGTASEINFWDVIYHHLYVAGGWFETSTRALTQETGFTRQVIRRLLKEAKEHGDLCEDTSLHSGRRFMLSVPGYEPRAKGTVWKPLGYVENGWLRVIALAIPKRVLNLYLQEPRQEIYDLPLDYVAQKCRRYYLYENARSENPVNQADVGKALRLLVRLGLFIPEPQGYRIRWAIFEQKAPKSPPETDPEDFKDTAAYKVRKAAAPQIAQRALLLAEAGNFNLETHFEEIFQDLRYAKNVDVAALQDFVTRRRHRPPAPDRWQSLWEDFRQRQEKAGRPIQIIYGYLKLYNPQGEPLYAYPVKGRLSIGRAPDNNIQVPVNSESTSRYHAQITVIEGEVWLRDLGSTNGTFINGTRLLPNQGYQLQSGDAIALGSGRRPTAHLHFEPGPNPPLPETHKATQS